MGVRLDVFVGEEPRIRAVVNELGAHPDAWRALLAMKGGSVPAIEHVIQGERRWWIAGLIEWARASRLFPATDLEEIEGDLAELVGPLGLGDLRVARRRTPLSVPWTGSNHHVASWDAATTTRVARAAELLVISGIAPTPRPARVGIVPDDWETWVRECTASLIAIADGHLQEPALISFCG